MPRCVNGAAQRLQQVRRRIDRACREAGRDPASVVLIAVSKQHPAERVRVLFGLGQVGFGENRLQEALAKQGALADLAITWHFIGPVQSNKTREVAAHFDWVQSVDREKILRRLSGQRPAGLPPLNICIQVNIDAEPQKAGLDPAEVPAFASAAAAEPRIRLRGLMAIPRPTDDEAQARDSFRRMKRLYDDLRNAGHALDTLSMGMSGDLELAVQEGSTMVRVGTDLLGPRGGANDRQMKDNGL